MAGFDVTIRRTVTIWVEDAQTEAEAVKRAMEDDGEDIDCQTEVMRVVKTARQPIVFSNDPR